MSVFFFFEAVYGLMLVGRIKFMFFMVGLCLAEDREKGLFEVDGGVVD
jgi:hypothetical protein